MGKFFTSSILILVLVITGCKKASNETCVDGRANFPFMATGHKALYHLHFSSPLPVDDDTATYTIGAETSGKYSVDLEYASSRPGSLPYVYYWWACGKDYYQDTTANSNIHWYVSLNSNIGDTWTTGEGSNFTSYQLLSKNASVTSALTGQTFANCYKFTVVHINGIEVDTTYFQPTVGLVYYNGPTESYELISRNY